MLLHAVQAYFDSGIDNPYVTLQKAGPFTVTMISAGVGFFAGYLQWGDLSNMVNICGLRGRFSIVCDDGSVPLQIANGNYQTIPTP
jgi:hypothetical protein